MKHTIFFNLFTLIFVTAFCQCNFAPKNHFQGKDFTNDPNIPQPTGFVNDFENIYSKSEEITLDSVIKDYNKRADIQIALATFDSGMVKKDSFQSYTLKVAQQWRVGEKEKDNGLFIGICKGYRIMYIQNGIGTAKILSDAATKSIIDTAFIPEFKKNNVYAGTLKGMEALMITLSAKKH
ncbi:TPM domain-containing protein [Taibaiella lutea]|uniref:TPM domain-containing protein n=1 Tax=Taibaiella lutea TaxID=2608001 RepID=UPI00167FDF60|nr:TPM domain-containing protein [Taibaiella lutea]